MAKTPVDRFADARTWVTPLIDETATSRPPDTTATSATSAPAEAESAATGSPDSIAVLPLSNLSDDPAQEFFVAGMHERGIGVGVHYPVVHLFEHYRRRFGFRRGDFPVAEDVGQNIVSLPLFPEMTERDQDRVVAAMRELLH